MYIAINWNSLYNQDDIEFTQFMHLDIIWLPLKSVMLMYKMIQGEIQYSFNTWNGNIEMTQTWQDNSKSNLKGASVCVSVCHSKKFARVFF